MKLVKSHRLQVVYDGVVIFDRDVENLEFRDDIDESSSLKRHFEFDATYEAQAVIA